MATKCFLICSATLASVLLLSRTSLAQQCEQVFQTGRVPTVSSSVTAGYRLNSYVLKRALEEPSTRDATVALLEVAALVEKAPAAFLTELLDSRPSEPAKAAIETQGFVQVAGFGKLSVAAADMLATSADRSRKVREKARGPHTNDPVKQMYRLRVFFKDRAVHRRLPHFRDVLEAHPRLFASFAEAIHSSALGIAGNLVTTGEKTQLIDESKTLTLMEERKDEIAAYPERLAVALKAATGEGALKLEQAILIAIAQTEDPYRTLVIRFYDSTLRDESLILKAIGPEYHFAKKNSMREAIWQIAGVALIETLARDLVDYNVKQNPGTTDTDLPSEAVSYAFLKTVLPEKSAEFVLIYEALLHRMSATQIRERDPEVNRKRLRDQLLLEGEKIRHQIKNLDQHKQQAFDEALTLAKRSTVQAAKPLSSGSHGGIRVTSVQGNLVKKPKTVEISPAPQVSLPPQPSDVRPLALLLKAPHEQGIRYQFKFPNHRENNYVVISETVLSQLAKKKMDLAVWVAAFFIGPTTYQGMNGMKIIHGFQNDPWEIKALSSSHRIVVVQDKKTNTWHWRALVPHDRVEQYCRAHKL